MGNAGRLMRWRRSGMPGVGRVLIAALAALLILSVTRGPALARHVTAERVLGAGARLEPLPCWFDVDIGRRTDCFQLVVPFDWSDPASPMQHLPVVIFRATEDPPPADPPVDPPVDPSSDPIVFLNGGPGQRADIEDRAGIVGWAAWLERQPWTEERDFIIPTQRGTNWTDSNLHCAELGDPRVYAGATSEPGDVADWRVLLRRAYIACRDRMIAAGVPIAAFNTKQNATDMAALRYLLGLDTWTLYGASYGTRLALTLMRHDPDGVGRAILDSVWPPALIDHDGGAKGLDRALRLVFESCRRQAYCDYKYPRLEDSFTAIADRLRRQSLVYAISSPDKTQTLYVRIDAGLFIDILFFGLYWWQDIERIPRLIDEFARGDATTFGDFADDYFADEGYQSQAHGMNMAIWCNDDSAFIKRDKLSRQNSLYPLIGDWIDDAGTYLDACDGWPLNEPDPWEKSPVVSDSPTLLLAGAFDPTTPPQNARLAAETLSRAYVFVIPAIGHDAINSHECASVLVAAFLDNPGMRPDSGCLDAGGTPRFK